jgi:hypothetical protein
MSLVIPRTPASPRTLQRRKKYLRPVLGIVSRGFDGANSQIVVIEALLAT